MEHLKEQIARYAFDDLNDVERQVAEEHLAECAACRQELLQLRSTVQSLHSWADEEPPRHIVFEPVHRPKRLPAWMDSWKWAAPVAATALLAVVVAWWVPVRAQWADGQFTVAFGNAAARETSVQPAPVVPVAVATSPVQLPPADYVKVLDDLRKSEREWMVAELDRRERRQSIELQRIRASIAYFDSLQQTAWKETIQNSASIQLLARRTERQDSQN